MRRSHGKEGERGIALISVLALIFTGGILTGAMVMIAQVYALDTAANLKLMRAGYIAEGATNRVIWLVAADRANYSEASPGETDYADYATERFFADSLRRTLDYYGTEVIYYIEDAVSGIDVSTAENLNNAFFQLQAHELDSTLSDRLTPLLDVYTDYVDSDDDPGNDGMESDDYAADGRAPLPRNAPLQFREELYYLPGFTEVFPVGKDGRYTAFRLISLIDSVDMSGLPALLTAPAWLIRAYAGYTEEEAQDIMEAIAEYKEDRGKLSDKLEGTTLQNLLQYFALDESGIYTIRVQVNPTTAGGSRLSSTFAADNLANPIEFLEFLRY